MDKLRSLQYFIASAGHGSFSGAARSLEVTIPAVAKLVSTLEKDLGVRLFERSAQGLVLTASGESYLESCRPAVAALAELDERMRASATRARGTVVVGIQHLAAKELIGRELPRFLARHPEIQVDLRESTQLVAPDAPGVDLYISFSWPQAPDMIHRSLAMTRFVVCASPGYWAVHGVPGHPRELADRNCLLIRTQTGMVMDVWNFKRGAETEQVTVKGSLVCNNAHRDVAISLAVEGQGIVRTLEWSNRAEVASGALVPALTDWELPDAPPMNLSYRPSARRTARVRLFIDFVLEVFRELESPAARVGRVGNAPHWANRYVARASSLPRARR